VVTCSFEEKDGSEGCRKGLRVRGEACALVGELHQARRAVPRHASLRDRPPCSMPVADSQPAHGSQCFQEGCWRAACRLPRSSCTTTSSTAGQRAPRPTTSSVRAAFGSRMLRWCVRICAVRADAVEACETGAADGFDEPQKALLAAICGGHDWIWYNSSRWHAGAAPLCRLHTTLCLSPYACVRCVNRTRTQLCCPQRAISRVQRSTISLQWSLGVIY
jgi:hypothetical protein